jgi:hypothetical protein
MGAGYILYAFLDQLIWRTFRAPARFGPVPGAETPG